jgi:hypothetical protein
MSSRVGWIFMHDLKPNSTDWREGNKVTGWKRGREQPYDVNVEIIGCVRVTLCSSAVFWILIGWPFCALCGIGGPAARNKFQRFRETDRFCGPRNLWAQQKVAFHSRRKFSNQGGRGRWGGHGRACRGRKGGSVCASVCVSPSFVRRCWLGGCSFLPSYFVFLSPMGAIWLEVMHEFPPKSHYWCSVKLNPQSNTEFEQPNLCTVILL